MIKAFLDSFVLSCPLDAEEPDIVSLLRSLMSWRELSGRRWIKVYASAQAAECISNAGGGFPPWDALSRVIVKNQIDISPKDVFSLINGYLNRLPKIEEELGVKDILIDDISCAPAVHSGRGPV